VSASQSPFRRVRGWTKILTLAHVRQQPTAMRADTRVMRFTNRHDMVLYLWDYFYISRVPAPGDEELWAAIERATCRIHASDGMLGESIPPDVRLKHARRMRDAARLARKRIDELAVAPARWVVDALVEIEQFGDDMIAALGGMDVMLH
jgi:hypothetical protein